HTLHAESNGDLRAACVRSLAHLATDDPLVAAALSDPSTAVVSAGVRALVNEPRKAPRAEVLTLLEDEGRATGVLPELVEYSSSPGQPIAEAPVAQLLRSTSRPDIAPEVRLQVLAGLPKFGISTPISNKLKKELDPLVASADSALKDAALVALTQL